MKLDENYLRNTTVKALLKKFKIIHTAFIVGLASFLVIVIYVNQQTGGISQDDPILEDIFLIVGNVMLFTMFAIMYLFIKYRGDNKNDLKTKLARFGSVHIVRSAMFEGCGLFFVIIYQLTNSFYAILEASAIILVLVYLFPYKSRIIDKLNLTHQEINELNK